MKIKQGWRIALRLLGVAGNARSHWLACALELKNAHDRGDLTGAARIAQRCQASGKPESSEHYLIFLNNLGLLYSESGNSKLAIQAKEGALELSRHLYPTGHPDIVDAQLGLAVAHLYAGDAAQALPILIDAQRAASASAFAKPELALRVFRTLGSAYHLCGAQAHALQFARLAYAMALSQRVPPAELSFFQSELGLVLIDNEQPAEALELLEAAYAGRLSEHPHGHYGVASAAHNLGWVHEKLGQWRLAQTHYDIAVQWRAAHLGASNPATRRSSEGLQRVEDRLA